MQSTAAGLNVHAKEWRGGQIVSSGPGSDESTPISTPPLGASARRSAAAGGQSKLICHFFAMGDCRNGADCPYSHTLTQEAPEGVDASSGFFISGRVANLPAVAPSSSSSAVARSLQLSPRTAAEQSSVNGSCTTAISQMLATSGLPTSSSVPFGDTSMQQPSATTVAAQQQQQQQQQHQMLLLMQQQQQQQHQYQQAYQGMAPSDGGDGFTTLPGHHPMYATTTQVARPVFRYSPADGGDSSGLSAAAEYAHLQHQQHHSNLANSGYANQGSNHTVQHLHSASQAANQQAFVGGQPHHAQQSVAHQGPFNVMPRELVNASPVYFSAQTCASPTVATVPHAAGIPAGVTMYSSDGPYQFHNGSTTPVQQVSAPQALSNDRMQNQGPGMVAVSGFTVSSAGQPSKMDPAIFQMGKAMPMPTMTAFSNHAGPVNGSVTQVYLDSSATGSGYSDPSQPQQQHQQPLFAPAQTHSPIPAGGQQPVLQQTVLRQSASTGSFVASQPGAYAGYSANGGSPLPYQPSSFPQPLQASQLSAHQPQNQNGNIMQSTNSPQIQVGPKYAVTTQGQPYLTHSNPQQDAAAFVAIQPSQNNHVPQQQTPGVSAAALSNAVPWATPPSGTSQQVLVMQQGNHSGQFVPVAPRSNMAGSAGPFYGWTQQPQGAQGYPNQSYPSNGVTVSLSSQPSPSLPQTMYPSSSSNNVSPPTSISVGGQPIAAAIKSPLNGSLQAAVSSSQTNVAASGVRVSSAPLQTTAPGAVTVANRMQNSTANAGSHAAAFYNSELAGAFTPSSAAHPPLVAVGHVTSRRESGASTTSNDAGVMFASLPTAQALVAAGSSSSRPAVPQSIDAMDPKDFSVSPLSSSTLPQHVQETIQSLTSLPSVAMNGARNSASSSMSSRVQAPTPLQ